MTTFHKFIMTSIAFFLAGVLAAAQQVSVSAEPEVATLASSASAAEAAPDRESDLYNQGTAALDASKWQEARDIFDQVSQMHGAHADGALYWKAYTLNKQGRQQDALAAIAQLEKAYPESHWNNDAKALDVEIRQSMGQSVSPENVSNEDLKLIAISGLMNSDPERAVPLLEKVLQGNQPPKVKERAMFVLSQSGSPKAHQVIFTIASGQGDRSLQHKAIEDLALFGGKDSKAELAQIYAGSSDVEVKRSILRAFMVSGEKERVLAAAKTEKNPELRSEAVKQLGVMGAGDELWQLYQTESSPEVKREIIKSLFVGGKVERLESLAQSESNEDLRREAIRSLGLMGPRTSDTLASIYQSDKAPEIRKEIMNAFFLQNNAKALVNVARTETNPELRKTAVEKLSLMNSKDATDYMMEILNK